MALTKLSVGMIDATSTASSTTFLRGDGVWATVSSYNQSLNTTDSVEFAGVTTPTVSGTGGLPVLFPTGIDFGTI